jgi:YbbR domain-containing protein
MQNSPSAFRFIRDNLGWMVGSLLLSVIVWYVASAAQNPVEQRRLPSQITVQLNTDEGMLVVGEVETTAQVTVRAPRSVWDVLAAEDIGVVADLSKRGPGKYTVPLVATLSKARHGIVTDIQPSQITVELARRSEQLVSVNIVRMAEPPPGFVANPTPADSAARIVGPETLVTKVVAVQARISLQDQRTTFTRSVPLVAVDADNKEVTGVEVSPTAVNVTVEITTRSDVTELSVIPNLIGELPEGYLRRNYSWEPNSVLVRGDRTTIGGMNGFVSTEAIDLTGKTAAFTQRVKLALPFGVTTTDPIDISVTVQIEPIIGSREFDNVPVQTQGLDPADFQITVLPDRVNVIVSGPQIILNTLEASDISVIAPLSGLSTGKFPVTLEASVTKPGINAQDIVIPNAKVEVTIVALNPTVTPTAGPTRTVIPVATEDSTPTAAP